MPTYQYRCRSCDDLLEVVQKFTDPALTECPECGGELRKVYSPVGIAFKGSGFYATDNRSQGRAEAKPKDGAAKDSGKESAKESAGAAKDAGSTAGTGSAAASKPAGGSSTASA